MVPMLPGAGKNIGFRISSPSMEGPAVSLQVPSAGLPGPPWSILLAGGDGNRLSALVRWYHPDGRPKQFAALVGTRSMLQHTYARAASVSPPDRILVVLTPGQERWAREQLPGLPMKNFLVQPRSMGTGPAVCLAIAQVLAEEAEASVVTYPADHFIYPEEKFGDQICRALAPSGAPPDLKIVLFGVKPANALEGMGWIVPGKPVEAKGKPPLFLVDRFMERATPDLARKLTKAGAFLNTFIMAGRARTFLYLIWNRLPKAAKQIHRYCCECWSGADLGKAAGAFDDLDAFDFSRVVLQRAEDHLLFSPLSDIHWRDWDTLDGFCETIEAMGWTDRAAGKDVPYAGARSVYIPS